MIDEVKISNLHSFEGPKQLRLELANFRHSQGYDYSFATTIAFSSLNFIGACMTVDSMLMKMEVQKVVKASYHLGILDSFHCLALSDFLLKKVEHD